MNPHRLILELVDGPVDEHGDYSPKERWFLKLRRDSGPDDPWGIQIPIDYSVTQAPAEVLNFMRIATRYLIHNQKPEVKLTSLEAIPETDWNAVFAPRRGPKAQIRCAMSNPAVILNVRKRPWFWKTRDGVRKSSPETGNRKSGLG
jgi:hypothetical protein